MNSSIKVYPPVLNLGRIVGGFLGCALASGVLFAWYHQQPKLNRYYLGPYVSVSLREKLPKIGRGGEKPGQYVVLTNQASSGEIVKPSCGPSAMLTTQYRMDRYPAMPVTSCTAQLTPVAFRDLLESQVFRAPAGEVIKRPGILAGSLLVCGVLGGIAYDRRRRRRMVLNGQQTQGPVLMSAGQYNRKMWFGKDGLRIVTVASNRKVDF